jgi:hypothetical protein
MAKKINTFNVLWYNFYKRKPEPYDVLPYFRECWKDKHKYMRDLRAKVTDKESLKIWIKHRSQYKFWAKSEYEWLISSWPFGSKRMYDKLREVLADFSPEKLGDWRFTVDLDNAITCDMEKIDIHDQIMMNIDIITDILYNEFKLNENI